MTDRVFVDSALGDQFLPRASEAIEPFRLHVPARALEDLRSRLDRVRWPDEETVSDLTQGVPLAKAKALVGHWHGKYDWREFEQRLNRHPQFRTRIDGLGIHFIHVRSRHGDALPIVMTHGWPGSIVEFLRTIDPLTNPTEHGGRVEDAFHVVIPSIPGYGLSDRPRDRGWNAERTARAWAVLMRRLGYSRWVAQGGDWGSLITHRLAQHAPAGLAAAHVNLPLIFPSAAPQDPTADERQALEGLQRFSTDGAGYAAEQGTRPQTIAYALTDSPVGQATWIYEKLQAWSDNDGNAEDALPLNEILDNISLYWLTNTAGSSSRYYWEVFRTGFSGYSAGHIDLPMGASIFPREFYRAPRSWAEKEWPNLFYWNEVSRGGHFAAWEEPEIFVDELRKAFRKFR